MRVLIDTSVWSLALRRQRSDLRGSELDVFDEWEKLVRSGRACLTGAIRQELLTGIRSSKLFHDLRQQLDYFEYIPVSHDEHDVAASIANTLRANGLSTSSIDALICAVANQYDLPIFTTDDDFARYARYVTINLHLIR